MSWILWSAVIAFSVASRMSLSEAAGARCEIKELSIGGKALKGHTFKTAVVRDPYECMVTCEKEVTCQSYNFVIPKKTCELNNRTKEAKPQYFVTDRDRFYMRRSENRVPLGSIPEMPGESCKEIKASEGGEAVSGNYWLDPANSGKAVVARCDMKTEVADFCIRHQCRNNATCVNGHVNYTCSCGPGWTGKYCKSDVDECASHDCDVNAICTNSKGSYRCTCSPSYHGDGKTCQIRTSCEEIAAASNPGISTGTYTITADSSLLSVYCHVTSDGRGWTLIARFSNNDNKTWMNDTGHLWYDMIDTVGMTTDPSNNTDMISQAFWSVSGRELKLTRSDDSSHTPLLETTGNCLGAQTFRSKVTSYGDFRNGKVWSSDMCLRSCAVHYGGQYRSTDGFKQAECSSEIQSANKIGFWCDWSTGDGAVMMIGGGGTNCTRADHGIGVTEMNEASFGGGDGMEFDFGDETAPSTRSYSLNLWIR